uniref:Uncharacterized protein n=1 Tax=Meloidogyne incognita TaxID=6306 RepID=A0A914NCD8_MELIC
MVYSLETPSDVKQHERFHNRFTETANFRVSQTQIEQWKSVLQHENVESPLPGILFGVRSTSTATLKRKLETIITVSLRYFSYNWLFLLFLINMSVSFSVLYSLFVVC